MQKSPILKNTKGYLAIAQAPISAESAAVPLSAIRKGTVDVLVSRRLEYSFDDTVCNKEV